MSSDAKIPGEEVVITLPRAQALVLFEFLSRFNEPRSWRFRIRLRSAFYGICSAIWRVFWSSRFAQITIYL